MGMKTSAQIQIAKPAAEVFRWLIEPAKLTAWAGGAGVMPADPAALHSGFEASGPIPALAGDATTIYTLSESGGATTLASSSDTDWGKPDLSELEKQAAQQSPEIQAAMHHAIDLMNQQVGAGAFDATAQQGMQAALEASLAKLKQLAEAD